MASFHLWTVHFRPSEGNTSFVARYRQEGNGSTRRVWPAPGSALVADLFQVFGKANSVLSLGSGRSAWDGSSGGWPVPGSAEGVSAVGQQTETGSGRLQLPDHDQQRAGGGR